MLAIGHPILLGTDMEEGLIRMRQFHPPEENFAWSLGHWAEIEFDFETPRPARAAAKGQAAPAAPGLLAFTIDLDVFRVPPVLQGQNVLTYLNGLRVSSEFVTGRTMLSFAMRPEAMLPTGNKLVFDLPDAIRPQEFGMDDNRLLGVKLFSLAVDQGM